MFHTGDPTSYDESMHNKNYLDSSRGMAVMNNSNNQQHQPPNDVVAQTNQILTQNELQLCSALNVTPTKYLTLKTVLLNGNVQIKCTNLSENSIKKFLTKAGWVQQQTTTT
jgi:hypothetical protein